MHKDIAAEEIANEIGIKNHMCGFAGSLKDLYFLVSLARKVQVLYGLNMFKVFSESWYQRVMSLMSNKPSLSLESSSSVHG